MWVFLKCSVKCLTGGGTVLYLTQKTAAIRPMSLKITSAVSGAKTEQIRIEKKGLCNSVTKCRKQHFKSKVQYLVWAQRKWDWGIKNWWESYQPVGQERCPERTSAWAKSWQCNRPAVSRKTQCVKNPAQKVFLALNWTVATGSSPGPWLQPAWTEPDWGESAAGWSGDPGKEPTQFDTHTGSWGLSTGSHAVEQHTTDTCLSLQNQCRDQIRRDSSYVIFEWKQIPATVVKAG